MFEPQSAAGVTVKLKPMASTAAVPPDRALRVRPTKRSSGTGTPWRFSTSPGRFYPGVGSGAPRVTSARSLAFSQLTPLWSRVRFRLSPRARLLRRGLAFGTSTCLSLAALAALARNIDVALGQSTPTSSLMARE